MVSALSLTVDLASVFQGVSKGAVYSLRTIVCYFGHHYQVHPPGRSPGSLCWCSLMCGMSTVQAWQDSAFEEVLVQGLKSNDL